MQEIELKFQVTAERLDAVRAAVLAVPQASADPMAMHAAYFDTPDGRLAARKMAVRVRREGSAWVQTFKAGGADAMTRLEDNVALPPQGPAFRDGRPVADLSRHSDAAVQRALAEVLGEAPHHAALGVVYETVFDRRTAEVSEAHGVVQLCLDQGEVRAGNRTEALCELEFELLDGSPRAVIDAARRWVDAHGLWLDVQSKAYRGTRLAHAVRAGQAPMCRPVPVEALQPAPLTASPLLPASVPDAALHAWLLSTLNTALDVAAGNLSEVAWARPGWEGAALAWRQALAQLEAASRSSGTLRRALPADTWTLGDRLLAALNQPTPAMARSAGATHWALDVLGAISTLTVSRQGP